MIQHSRDLSEEILTRVAQDMCASAKTAPKTCGIDNIVAAVVTGDDIKTIADKMIEVDKGASFISRDANNIKKAKALVLIGVKNYYYGLNCADCGFDTCKECKVANANCAFATIDLGIAVGSAVSVAAAAHIDNRIMYSVGKFAKELPEYKGPRYILGIPLSMTGKNPFFDRK